MELKEERDLLYYEENGRGIAWVEMIPDKHEENIVEIRSINVSPMYRSQGIGTQLVEETVEKLRRDGRRATVSSRFASEWFEEHPQARDVLV